MRVRTAFVLLLLCLSFIDTTARDIPCGAWTLSTDESTHCIDLSYKGRPILQQTYAAAKDANGRLYYSYDADEVTYTQQPVHDVFGTGTKHLFVYKQTGKPTMQRIFYSYPEHTEYLLTELVLSSDEVISTNYMEPLSSGKTSSPVSPAGSKVRMLKVPFSNDNWTRYRTAPLSGSHTSYGVTTFYDGASREGTVIGAVGFDTWKTGITAICTTRADESYVKKLQCICGVVDYNTDDSRAKPSVNRHGAIKGTQLRSSKMMIGCFDDWRRGLETYADGVALVTPPRKSIVEKTFFGWNSWATLADNLNYEAAIDVSDFLAQQTYPEFSDNTGKVYVVLDSFWDYMTRPQLRSFVRTCVKNGQIPGIYWTPFSDWNGYEGYSEEQIGNIQMNGSEYTFGDAMLRYNGKKVKLGGWCLDPTHPGTKARIKAEIEMFKQLGFKYVKLDFINNGAVEADKYYDPSVTTGMQAYNHGMAYIVEQCGDDFFIDLGISPVFPAHYAHARRISCDAWGNAASSEMVVNCMAYGWWLDRLYNFNDADHAKFEGFTEGENRIRMTTEVISGHVLLGDNFSLSGKLPGTVDTRETAKKVILNKEVNDVARNCGRTFYPVYGYNSPNGEGEQLMMFNNGAKLYLAVFNYDAEPQIHDIPVSDLGIQSGDIKQVRELWTKTNPQVQNGTLQVSVPGKDVRLLCLDLSPTSYRPVSGESECTLSVDKQSQRIVSNVGLQTVRVFTLDGLLVEEKNLHGDKICELPCPCLSVQSYILHVVDQHGNHHQLKVFAQGR